MSSTARRTTVARTATSGNDRPRPPHAGGWSPAHIPAGQEVRDPSQHLPGTLDRNPSGQRDDDEARPSHRSRREADCVLRGSGSGGLPLPRGSTCLSGRANVTLVRGAAPDATPANEQSDGQGQLRTHGPTIRPPRHGTPGYARRCRTMPDGRSYRHYEYPVRFQSFRGPAPHAGLSVDRLQGRKERPSVPIAGSPDQLTGRPWTPSANAAELASPVPPASCAAAPGCPRHRRPRPHQRPHLGSACRRHPR